MERGLAGLAVALVPALAVAQAMTPAMVTVTCAGGMLAGARICLTRDPVAPPCRRCAEARAAP